QISFEYNVLHYFRPLSRASRPLYMPLSGIQRDLHALREVLKQHPDGIAPGAIESLMNPPLPRRTLNRRLAEAVAEGMARREGAGKAALYFPTSENLQARFTEEGGEVAIPLS